MPDTLFRELADNAPVLIWRSGADRHCDWFNQRWLDFAGEDMVSAVQRDWLAQVHPDDREEVARQYRDAFDRRSKVSMTFRMLRYDGVWRTVLYNGAPFNREGTFAGYYGSCTDVSEQHEAQAQLEQAGRERDALLREVYHRVKNNLQLVQGLIAMEAAAILDQKVKSALFALSGRVQSMGLVHHMLMRSQDLAHISARALFSELCTAIATACGADRRGLNLKIEVADTELDIERAVVKGLILHELLMNSFKHAFPSERHGEIAVRFQRHASGASTLEVQDDGVGVGSPSRISADEPHIGATLVKGLVNQLRGVLFQSSPGGSGYLTRIEFPALKSGEAQ